MGSLAIFKEEDKIIFWELRKQINSLNELVKMVRVERVKEGV